MTAPRSRPSTRPAQCNRGAARWIAVRTAGLAFVLAAGLWLVPATPAAAQDVEPTAPSRGSRVATGAQFLAGAALGLAVHESGHLLFDVAFSADPGVARVSYAGIPFFAITHQPVTARREAIISSAGFWMQHASSEWLLSRGRPLRERHAPVAKGWLAFNVLTSVMYAGAALGTTGPDERDTRGIAVSTRLAEPWVAPVILSPAILDAVRYVKPQSRTLRWASRAAKVGGALLVLRARTRD